MVINFHLHCLFLYLGVEFLLPLTEEIFLSNNRLMNKEI